jgi:23S rRNA (cytidine1920-2'-O)/16S rRNA (cytidine1409-2'-O)-methyltransferase
VVDVSFISLKLVVPPAFAVLKPEGDIIALVKPQFEVGKDAVENKGIIKDPKKHLNVLLDLRVFMEEQKWPIVNLSFSPITGQKGNREFLIHCVCNERAVPLTDEHIRNKVLKEPE